MVSRRAINIPPLRGGYFSRRFLFSHQRRRLRNRYPVVGAVLFTCFILQVISTLPATLASDSKVFIRINQLGYRPIDPKSAIAFSRDPLPQRYTVINSQTHQIAFEGAAESISDRWGQFAYHAQLDFSSFQQTGKYFIPLGDVAMPRPPPPT